MKVSRIFRPQIESLESRAVPAANVTGLDPTTDTGSSNTDEITNNPTPIIVGTAAANSIVTVKSGDTTLGTTTADADGHWTFTPPNNLSDGMQTLSAADTNGTGQTLAITIDSGIPVVPTNLALAPESDTGTTGDKMTSDDAPTITGVGEPGTTITLYDGEQEVGSGVVASDGTWSITTDPLIAGFPVLSATATDLAGNVSDASEALVLSLDSTPPDTSTAPDLRTETDRGSSSTDNITFETKPTFTGTVEAEQTVSVFDGDALIGTAIADAQGVWTFTPNTDLTDGTHQISITVTDAAGNVSEPSPTLAVTIDSTGLVANPIRDVSQQVRVRKSAANRRQPSSPGQQRQKAVPTFRQMVTITNRTGQTIDGPLHLVVAGLDSRFRVLDANGKTQANGNPFVTINASGLAPGESLTVVVKFQFFGNVSQLKFGQNGLIDIPWNARLLAGLGEGF